MRMRAVLNKVFMLENGVKSNSKDENSSHLLYVIMLNLHLHFRRREKMWNKFRSMHSLQKFTSIHATFLNHFNSGVRQTLTFLQNRI